MAPELDLVTDQVGPILARIAAAAAKLGLVGAEDAPPCEWPEGTKPKREEPEEPEPWWNK